jgi:putative transposase
MANDFIAGESVLYQGAVVEVLEPDGHDQLLIRTDIGICRIKRNEVIALNRVDGAIDKTSLADIPNEAWHEASRRAAAIRTVLAADGDQEKVVETHASCLGISSRHLWRLIRRFKKNPSISELLPKTKGRKVGTCVLDLSRERIISDQIEAFYLQRHRPTVKSLHERIETECRSRGLEPVSLKAVKHRLKYYDNRDAQKRRIGGKNARYTYQGMPGHVDVSAPLERVEIDHTLMDVMVRSDDPKCGYVARPWVTLAVDVHTRCVLGMHMGFEPPSALSIALCLTHAVLPKDPNAEFGVPLEWEMHGLPREIVVDNGKDFTSHAFRRGCEEYGIILSHRPVGSPHYGGTIERLIGTMVGQCHLLPGTTKNSIRAKRDYDSKKHAAMTLSALRTWFVEQILGRYHLKEHRMLRMPPIEAWKHGFGGGDASRESA